MGEICYLVVAHLPGYTKLPGKAERYKTPSGETISRRQYENKRFRQVGWRSWSEYQREARKPQFRRWVEKASSTLGPKRQLKSPQSEFSRMYIEAKRTDWKHDADGPFSDFLKWLGIRDEQADYPVGDTPR